MRSFMPNVCFNDQNLFQPIMAEKLQMNRKRSKGKKTH